MIYQLKLLSFNWIILPLFVTSKNDIHTPLNYYNISKRLGEKLELLCEWEHDIKNLVWFKKNESRWSRIYKSFQNGFQDKWGEVFRLDRYNLVTDNVTKAIAGEYKCLNQDATLIISSIILTVLEPCPECSEGDTSCKCSPVEETASTQVNYTRFLSEKEITTLVMSTEEFKVECDKDCRDHELLLCRREKWRLKCEKAELPECNTEVRQDLSRSATMSLRAPLLGFTFIAMIPTHPTWSLK